MAEHTADSEKPLYEWDIEVQRVNAYGDRIVSRTPTKILASTKSEVTTKVRAMFGATYDDFRRFWSHTWTLNSVREVQRVITHAVTEVQADGRSEVEGMTEENYYE